MNSLVVFFFTAKYDINLLFSFKKLIMSKEFINIFIHKFLGDFYTCMTSHLELKAQKL